ncbi:hypothetical protein F4781DRAFT_75998 [Annulohypoxylon bovei var. microspora]|nr:hypothetical protein F4781DRAFT_75998 [Annulohypoxylon bovei var. microspora]
MARPNDREMDVPGTPPGRISGHTLSRPVSHTGHDNTVAKTLPADISPEQQRLDLLSPAYLLEWPETQTSCFSRKRIGSVEELRANVIQGLKPEEYGHRERRFFVIHGLPAEYLRVLRDELKVDMRFLEAHVSRRAYRPVLKRSLNMADRVHRDHWTDTGTFACFEYPELLTSARRIVTTGSKQISSGVVPRAATGDVVGEAPTHLISTDGDYAMFCRASLWLSPKAYILLLDRPAGTRPSSEFRKAVYSSSGQIHSSLNPISGNVDESNIGSEGANSDREEIPSFESLFWNSLAGKPHKDIDKPTLIEDIVIHQWIQFFEALSSDLPSGSAETIALYRQIQKSLERNLSQSEFTDKRPMCETSATPTWQSLLSRLNRRISLQSYLNPPTPIATIQPAPVPPSSPSPSSSASNPRPRAQLTATALPPQTSHRSPDADEKNQQSLDRVSYMGGVLLPLSIVSSILSMSDPFGPGGSQFFVFWAVSVPLVFVTILVIYADSIRKAEVWIEVASSSTTGSEKQHEEEEEEEEEEVVSAPELEEGGGGGMRRRMRARTRTDGMGVAACEEDGYGPEEWNEPGMMVERMFKNPGKKKWRKEQLGWLGACKSVFRIYKLKKGRPPNWTVNGRRANSV